MTFNRLQVFLSNKNIKDSEYLLEFLKERLLILNKANIFVDIKLTKTKIPFINKIGNKTKITDMNNIIQYLESISSNSEKIVEKKEEVERKSNGELFSQSQLKELFDKAKNNISEDNDDNNSKETMKNKMTEIEERRKNLHSHLSNRPPQSNDKPHQQLKSALKKTDDLSTSFKNAANNNSGESSDDYKLLAMMHENSSGGGTDY